ncbi:MAG TPA: hypothetical protein DEG17_02320 [Cyanobacteria bacterium UBA11149]|nr:hypothetical protein [Cyanobacteria bacterium UBA11367]HBE57983.1 hypothetical protein [Cyanobacteria bacterium UBA11366]HBK66042.1 hypothetical protein [Cyanobacteria bacterium UBA11166]HBR74006.1 hypothetical protein [Cyanobacteria bacterium UBA11159]HBS69830.1 hypothetical protein [Cyanobacteria bacterium UBA11153]HBW87741.1 hypothetical protein [Cyanobacteria bacterium UBA11149]HCA96254.1 hypothetical protein [Cyanobacteria bacterium UBA9226]
MSYRSTALIDAPSRTNDASAATNRSNVANNDNRLLELMKSIYQADQQVKYLHLQAEVDSLLQQLKIIKQQRVVAFTPESRDP